MKYGIQWIVQGRVLYVIVKGDQNVSDLRGLIQVELDIIETQGTPPVHLIVDNTRLKDVHGSREASMEALNQVLMHPQVGWLVFIHPISALRQLIGTLMLRIVRIQWPNSRTLEEALNFLTTQDSSLPSLKSVEFFPPQLDQEIHPV